MKREGGWRTAFGVAVEGVRLALREQRHMRIHWLCASAVLLVCSGAKLDAPGQALILGCAALVLGAELVNTAIEAVVDLAAPALHPLAKKAKDAAAGAVLVLALGAALVLFVIVRDHWSGLDGASVRRTLGFGLPFLAAQAVVLVPARGWLRWLALAGGTTALVAGVLVGGDHLYVALLALTWLLSARWTTVSERS